MYISTISASEFFDQTLRQGTRFPELPYAEDLCTRIGSREPNVIRPSAILVRGAISSAEARGITNAITQLRAEWTRVNSEGFNTFGLAWYTHKGMRKIREYRERAEESDAMVDRNLPGFASRMRRFLELVTGEEVVARGKGWCSAGFHVLSTPQESGVIHCDVEGLSSAIRHGNVPMISAVLAVQPPASGGGLRLWNRTYDARTKKQIYVRPPNDVEYMNVAYEPGDLLVFDSYRFHQIQGHRGTTPRITATIHAARTNTSKWISWF